MSAAQLIDQTLLFLRQGGEIAYPLVGCGAVLWYVTGYRAFLLRRGTRLPVRSLVTLGRQGRAPRGWMGDVVRAALEAATRAPALDVAHLRRRLDEALGPYEHALDRGAVLMRTIVSISPLMGLLGTVMGMVGMFDSLGTSSDVLAQEGGIARGISVALFTTELGLIVAIPGYFLSRMLERRASSLRAEVEQLRDVLCGATTTSLTTTSTARAA